MKTKLIGIAAMDPNRVIGKGLTIPWHYSEDFKFFKRTTLGHPIIMGRSTFESLGSKPLPKRPNIVVSTTIADRGDIIIYRNGVQDIKENIISEYIPYAFDSYEKAFIIGGAQLYKDTFDIMDGLYVTHIKKEYDGDVFMPQFEEFFDKQETVLTNDDFEVKYYSK